MREFLKGTEDTGFAASCGGKSHGRFVNSNPTACMKEVASPVVCLSAGLIYSSHFKSRISLEDRKLLCAV